MGTTTDVANRWLLATIVVYRLLLSITLGRYIIFSNDVGVTTFRFSDYRYYYYYYYWRSFSFILTLYCQKRRDLFISPKTRITHVWAGGDNTYLGLDRKRIKKSSVPLTVFEWEKKTLSRFPSVFGMKTSRLQRICNIHTKTALTIRQGPHSSLTFGCGPRVRQWPLAQLGWSAFDVCFLDPPSFVIFVEFN